MILKRIASREILSFNPNFFNQFVPQRLKITRVTLDPKLLEDFSKKQEFLLKPTPIIISEPSNNTSKKLILEDIHPLQGINISSLEERKNDELIVSKNLPNTPLISVSLDKGEEYSQGIEKEISSLSPANHYSQLEDLLKEKEVLSISPAPLLLPTDLLFEYDADQLKIEAEKNLEKLALLIKKNPQAKFIIEGFTDNFGSEEYNLELSSRRANSIKEWLIKKQLVNGQQIEAYGRGKTHFIAPKEGTIQEQQLNRRVEIIIRKM